MSEESDPQAVTDVLDSAIDAFNEEGYGVPTREEEIDPEVDWKTQLTKACRLLSVVNTSQDRASIPLPSSCASARPNDPSRPLR